MKNYLMMLLLLLTIGASAAPVDRDAALKSAQSFFLKRGAKKPTKMSLVYKGRAPHAAKGRGVSAKNASYYIFNNDENGGFVIVSGDDRTPTILGYSDDGNIDADNIPDNMAEWLNGYAEQIEYLDEAGMEKLQVMRKVPTMRAIIPMLKSRWTQDEPFCNLLPEISGTHLPVGCGATAMAQLMYYHKWPDATQAEIPGYKNIYQYTGYDEIILDTIPANSPLDWENMLDVYNGKETEEQNNAVATLSKYCGVALEMNYRLGGSSSSLSDYPRVLSTYFGYDSKIKYVKRDNYSYDAWTQLMYSELLAGRPIAYGGQSSGGGHAFIIDGYDGEELFHINWGWNNGTDGYFLLSVLNPNDTSGTGASSTGSGYNSSQEAVIGIQPFTGGEPGVVPEEEEIPLHLTFTLDSIIGSTVYCTYYNYTGVQKLFVFSLGYYDDAGVLHTCSTIYGNNLPSGYLYYQGLDVQITEPGRYNLFLMSKVYRTDEWVPNPHVVEYIECIVDKDGTKTLIWHPIKALEASFTFMEPKMANVQEKVDVSIKNVGEEYRGNVYFKATNDEGDYSSTSSFNIQLIAGKTTKARVSFTPPKAGNYNVSLSTDQSGKNVIATSNVYISEGSFTTREVLRTKVSVENALKGKIYGNKIKGNYTITNPTDSTWAGNLRFFIYHNESGNGTYYAVQYIDYSEVLRPGESIDIPFEYTGVYGDYYIIGMKYRKTYNEVGASGSYQLARGYVGYTADGTVKGAPASGDIIIGDDIVAVDFSGISEDAITSITPNANPNTLYYFTNETTLKDKLIKGVNNMVEGLKSDRITLTDNCDFFVPITFTAKSVSYSRTPVLVSEGDAWETIALPFEVSKTIANGREIDFFHSVDDTNKDFWVREFCEYEGKDMFYGMTEKMEAYVPYLIGFSSSLQGKEVKFEGKNATLVADCKLVSGSQYYNLIGTMVALEKERIYTIANDGKSFILKDKATATPFHAYINAKYEEDRPISLPITLIDSSILMGDVNDDKVVTVSDVVMLVNYILGIDVDGIKLSNADLNGDGAYTVSDVIQIVNIILGNN